jgi:hypothetical protein
MQHGPQVARVTIIDYDAGQKYKCDHTKFHYLQSYLLYSRILADTGFGKQE